MFGPNEAELVNTTIATSDFSEEHDTSTIECFFSLKELRFASCYCSSTLGMHCL